MKANLKKSLPAAVADFIEGEIAAGRMRGRLPGERQLGAELNVSRGSLRTALAILRRRGVVNSRARLGSEALGTRAASDRTIPSSIGILAPIALETHRLFYALELEKIRELLQPLGLEVATHYGRAFFTRNPKRALQRLTEKNPHRCWILFLSTPGTQRWFAASGLPCMVAGSCLVDVDLPFVDLDQCAMGRHAAGLVVRHGHRTVALLCRHEESPGLVHGREGFVEQCAALDHAGVHVAIIRHDDTVNGVAGAVRRALKANPRPTILVVETPNQYLVAQTTLQAMRLTIPADVSLLSRSSEPFLDFLLPAPVRYHVDPQAQASKIVHVVKHFLDDQVPPARRLLMMPELVGGHSVGPPASARAAE
jgi:DNA-binding LacI/PurR family transcriptional regulator